MDNNDQFIIRSILDDMSDGVLLIGFDGKIILHNQSAACFLAVHGQDMTGMTIARMMEETDENDSFFETVLDAVYEKKRIMKTLPFVRDEGMVYFHVTTDFLMKGSERVGIIVNIRDITEPTMLFIANKRLTNHVINIMNSFVEVMVTAIEEKSVYNANHTKSMVQYTKKYLECLRNQGRLTEYTSENTAPLLMSVWLHDIGKLLIPQEIMDKPTRLGNALKDILHRTETARLMLRIKELSGELSAEEANNWRGELDEAEKLILSADSAGMLDGDAIAGLRKAAQVKCPAADGSIAPLLNEAELDAITIVRGTLTNDERRLIQSHVSLTEKLLSKVEFWGDYSSVREWAAGHHEMLDGSGYPKHLQGDEIPWETRLITIIDIYDALTAEDRPYKPPLPPEKAFAILRDMAEKGKLDGTLLEDFYSSGAWKHDKL